MADDEIVGSARVEIRADASKLPKDTEAAGAAIKAALSKVEREAARNQKAIQGKLDQINATGATRSIDRLAAAVQKAGGVSALSANQLGRVTAEVNRLAAAGAKVPQALAGLTGQTSKIGAAFTALGTGGGISGALAAIGPAGVAAAAGFTAVAFTGAKAFGAIRDLASQAEQWTNLAKSTGLGVQQVQQLSTLLEDAGIPAEAMGKAFKELQKEIATGGKELQKFGIDVAELKNLSPEEQFREMASRIAAIEDPATKTAVALAAFGRSGQELIPVMGDVASGADKMFEALSDQQVSALAEADRKIDAFIRKLEFLSKQAIATGIDLASFIPLQGTASVFGGGGGAPPKAATGARDAGGDDAFWREQERQMAVERNEGEATAKEKKKAASEEARQATTAANKAKAAREKEKNEREQLAKTLLDAEKKTHEAALKFWEDQERLAEKATDRILADGLLREGIDRKQVNAAGELVEIVSQDAIDAARRRASKALGGSGQILSDIKDEGLPTGFFTRDKDIASDLGVRVGEKTESLGFAKAAEEAESRTSKLIDTFGTLSNQLTNLSQSVGGFAGKLLGIAASLSSGAGGIFSGIAGFKQAGSGFSGLLTKLSSGLGIVGSAIGLVGGVVGGIKKLFGGKSKEEKAAEAAAKKQAADEIKQQAVAAAQQKQAAAESARGFAESLSEKLAGGELSERLSGAVGAFVGQLGNALGKFGLGVVDSRLKESKGFQAATGVASDVAGGIAAARQAGIVDTGLLSATSGVATAVREEALAAAREAGLTEAEAQKQGSLAIAQILREQLNAEIQSTGQISATLQAQLDEAKANGLEILADPAIESLGVQREIKSVLEKGFGVVADTITDQGQGIPAGGAGIATGGPLGPVDDGFMSTFLKPTLERLATGIEGFDPGRAVAERLGETPEGEGTAASLDGIRDAIEGARPVDVTSAPVITLTVEGSADEKTIQAAMARFRDELRKRDAELDALIAASSNRAV